LIPGALALVLLIGAVNCRQSAGHKELMVLAAASLSAAFDEIKTAFEAEHENLQVIVSYGPSGALARQIEKGVAADIFASAGQPEMDRLEKLGLIASGSRFDYAGNELCLITRPGLSLRDWEDLTSPQIRFVGIGGRVAPVGDYARALLKSRELLEKVSAKLIPGNDVRQVMDYLLRGEVDAAIVYRTDAALFAHTGKLTVSQATAAPGDHPPIRYPIAAVKSSSSPEKARQFIAFVTGPEGQAILSEKGFSRIDP